MVVSCTICCDKIFDWTEDGLTSEVSAHPNAVQ